MECQDVKRLKEEIALAEYAGDMDTAMAARAELEGLSPRVIDREAFAAVVEKVRADLERSGYHYFPNLGDRKDL